jgi:hypothetical protein
VFPMLRSKVWRRRPARSGLSQMSGDKPARLLPHHRQGEVPQAGGAGYGRIPMRRNGARRPCSGFVARRGRGQVVARGGAWLREVDDGQSTRPRDRPGVISKNVSTGPCIIGPDVVIGDGCWFIAHVPPPATLPSAADRPAPSRHRNALQVRQVSRSTRRGQSGAISGVSPSTPGRRTTAASLKWRSLLVDGQLAWP